MSKKITPIFLFSMPRSGSTLVQRVLAAHEQVSTTPEPWILLPYLHTTKRQGVYAAYGHDVLVDAIEDFCGHLPGGGDDYDKAIREFATGLYAKAADRGATYFLDKTPRYHLIADDIIRIFPDARFIFLWRNPLAIVTSIINTWGRPGQWNLHNSRVDLFTGLRALIEVYEAHADQVCAVQYETLVAGGEGEWKRLFEFLGLTFSEDLLSRFSRVDVKGRMGDPTGVTKYNALNSGSVDSWKAQLANPVRKFWCKRYLRWIGKEHLAVMGYDMDSLIHDLDSTPTTMRWLVTDLIGLVYGFFHRWCEPKLYRDKFRRLTRGRTTYAHH